MTLTPKGTGRVTINGGGKIQQLAEKITIAATGTTGTVNYDVITQAVLYTHNKRQQVTLQLTLEAMVQRL